MHKRKIIESIVIKILHNKSKQLGVILVTLILLGISVMMFPTIMVKVKLLPKPTANYFTIYVDLPSGKSIEETKEVTQCITNVLKNRKRDN